MHETMPKYSVSRNCIIKFKVILCASEHKFFQSYDIASEALNNFKKIHYMY